MAYSMVYPQLVQYVPGPRIGSDWASSWKSSKDGLTWTFRLKKGKWSDGTPLTSADAVWTINTVLKYKSGPTSYVASSYEGIKGASAPDPQTLVITYSRPIAPALSNLSQILHPPEARLVDEAREEREGAEGVQAAGEPAGRRRRPVHRDAVRAEGHDCVQAEPVLLRPQVEVRGRGVHLLHECDVDGGRTGARQPRVHRRACRTAPRMRRRGSPGSRSTSATAPRSRTSGSTRTRRSRRTASSSARASRRRSSTRSRGGRSST